MSKQKKKALVPTLRFPEFLDTGEWELSQLNQVLLTISSGLAIEQVNDPSGFKVTRIETISDETINLNKIGFIKTDQDISSYRLNIGDILLSNINSLSHIGKNIIIDRDYELYHGMNLLRLLVDQGTHNSKFIFFLLNTVPVRASIKARANKAVNQASINQTELGRTTVITPKLPEQQKIASCLSSIDDLITAQSQKVEALKTHKKGLMQQLFPREGETVPRLRFPEFRGAGEWSVKTLRDISTINQGLQIPISKRFTEKVENSYFYITNEFLKENSKSTYYIQSPQQSVICNESDILMTRTGNTGQVVTNVSGAFHNNFFKIKYSSEVDKNFFIYFLRSENTQRIILSLAGTSTIPDLNHGDFYKIEITLPTTLAEQQKIADCLSSIDELINAHRQKLDALKTHKKGLMQQLFPAADEVEA